MAKSSKSSKRLFAMAYGLGASVVSIGALFKITHFEIAGIGGNVLLTIGLVTEALIFAISAFEPIDDDLDWSLVYPELAGGNAAPKSKKEAVAAFEKSKQLAADPTLNQFIDRKIEELSK